MEISYSPSPSSSPRPDKTRRAWMAVGPCDAVEPLAKGVNQQILSYLSPFAGICFSYFNRRRRHICFLLFPRFSLQRKASFGGKEERKTPRRYIPLSRGEHNGPTDRLTDCGRRVLRLRILLANHLSPYCHSTHAAFIPTVHCLPYWFPLCLRVETKKRCEFQSLLRIFPCK